MAIYTEIVSAGALKRQKYQSNAENSGTYVITVDTQTKQALIDGNEFETNVELNDLEFVNAIKQKSNLKGWRIAIEVNNGTTILIGKIIGVIQQEVGGVARTICSCLMSNGAYIILTINDENGTLSATLSSSGLISGGGEIEPNAQVPAGVEPIQLATAKIGEEYYSIPTLDNVQDLIDQAITGAINTGY